MAKKAFALPVVLIAIASQTAFADGIKLPGITIDDNGIKAPGVVPRSWPEFGSVVHLPPLL